MPITQVELAKPTFLNGNHVKETNLAV